MRIIAWFKFSLKKTRMIQISRLYFFYTEIEISPLILPFTFIPYEINQRKKCVVNKMTTVSASSSWSYFILVLTSVGILVSWIYALYDKRTFSTLPLILTTSFCGLYLSKCNHRPKATQAGNEQIDTTNFLDWFNRNYKKCEGIQSLQHW